MDPRTEVLDRFSKLDTYKKLISQKNKALQISGLNNLGKLLLVRQISEDTDQKIIYITKNEGDQITISQGLKELGAENIYTYPELKSEQINRQQYIDNFQTRSKTINALNDSSSNGIFMFSAGSLIEPLTISVSAQTIKEGDKHNPEKFLAQLISVGYERQQKVFQVGEISMRGGVVDIYPVNFNSPIRIEFDGEIIEKIIEFNPVDGKAVKTHKKIDINALHHGKINQYLLDLVSESPKKYQLIFNQADEIMQMLYELYQGNNNFDNSLLTTISKQLDKLASWQIVEIAADKSKTIQFDLVDAPMFANDLSRLATDLKKYIDKKWKIIIATNKQKQIIPVLDDNKVPYSHEDTKAPVHIVSAMNLEGVISPEMKLLLLTDPQIFAPIVQKTQGGKLTPKKRQLAFLAQIQVGDYVVHTDYGIGKLLEITTMTVNDVSREYLIIKYAGADKIYVPVDQIDKVSKYISPAGEKPTLSKLNSQSWKRLVNQIRKESQEFAKELLNLYAKRALKDGIAMGSPDFWEKALADSFVHKETPDQEEVIQDILDDMEQSKPMDRLLVADVGFGKTEVAIRATFKAVTSGYQVAVLAPTTILVEQHLKTFTERLAPFGTQVAALSRFRSAAEQKKVIAGLKTREVDVVIGTHRLLSEDVRFANLGLIIIDEEQRFGVRHKEKLKLIRAEVDVLSMTATPIPRTLNLALSGIRDISTIETPPINRLPIQTTVAPFDMNGVKDTILQEIKRGGQVYFVHNRVATIASITGKLEGVLPEVRFVYAHGQMPERLLAKIMEDFRSGKYDVLVASTIIENGLDNPNVNTLIVDNSSHFGLSQLHQLRGRIGRGKVQAYAYFYYNPGKLAGKALERLKTIAGHTELGSGYQIALRDLQIRGAGGVLSKKQHGHISAVGLTMYTKLLNRAIEELKTGFKPRIDSITVDLPLSAYLPTTYIDNEAQRIKTYQNLALIETEAELKDARAELENKFGKLPLEVENLFKLVDLKLIALETQKVLSIMARNESEIRQKPKQILNIQINTAITDKNILTAIEKLSGKIHENNIKIPMKSFSEKWLTNLKKFIKIIK
ncbi:MAG: transcription-repair coupling factor [Patescibacteria group bacterium]|nr:transcription-repair coupling factor [Patescibacteria group bacterium]